jgi:hypothetical protein
MLEPHLLDGRHHAGNVGLGETGYFDWHDALAIRLMMMNKVAYG